MEVSKLTLSQEMEKQLSNPYLSQKRKQQLREDLIKDYIRSKPAGTEISVKELIDAAKMQRLSRGSSYAFIKRMMKRKSIIRTEEGRYRYTWTIPGDAKTVKSNNTKLNTQNTPKVVKKAPIEQRGPIKVIKSTQEIKTPTIIKFQENNQHIINKIHEFYWKTTSNSLKEFEDWIKNERV